MDHEKGEYKGSSLWRTLEVLTVKNKDDWFRKLNRIAIGMDVLFVIEQTERQYCTIQVDKAGEEISPEAAWTLRRIEMQFPEQEWWSLEKEREFRKSSAAFLLNLELKISDLDRSRIEHCASANEAIKTLHTKYFAVTYQASSETIRAFTSWTMDMKIYPSNN